MTHNHRPGALALDIQATQNVASGERGTARYVTNHAQALMKVPEAVRSLLLNPLLPLPGHLPADLLASPLLDWNTATTFSRIAASGPIAYHIMSPFEVGAPASTFVPAHIVEDINIPLVVTLLDLIPLVMPDRYLSDRSAARRYHTRLHLIRRADHILTISEYSRQDALRLLDLSPCRVTTVGTGVSAYFQPPPPGSDPIQLVRRALPHIQKQIVLSVSGEDDRKNTERLIAAYARLPRALRRRYQLVIACKISTSFAEKWSREAARVGLDDDEMALTGYIPDPVLRALYQTAALFVFPSLYEGFGLPVAEAIACGCPALTSNTTSLPEILNFPPATFDPCDVDAIARAIERGLEDTAFREKLCEVAGERALTHRWDAVAERTVAALPRIFDATPSAATTTPRRSTPVSIRTQPRIALAGPLPPAPSGIADYNARVAAALAPRCRLDLLVPEGSADNLSRALPNTRQFPITALGTVLNPASYDAIIYTVGNSQHHHDTYEAAQRYPGIVWLHDVRLGGFYYTYGQARAGGDAQGLLGAKLDKLYGPRVPAHVIGDWTPEHQARYGLGLTAEWVAHARAIIVNSRFAAHLLRLDQGPDGNLPPVWTLPLAVHDMGRVVTTPPDRAPLIGSFGMISPVKSPELILDALALVRGMIPARLALVGDAQPAYRDELERYIDALGLTDAVEITGRINADDYQGYMARASCTVQWRSQTNGESSAAVRDAIASGVPCITNTIGAQEEFDDGAVVALDPATGAEELAAALRALLTDRELWTRQHDAALAHARRHTFADTATRLLDVISSLGEKRP